MQEGTQPLMRAPQYPTLTPDHFIIFLHIQKTAGMTMQRALRRRFGPGLATRVLWRLMGDARLSGSLEEAMRARKRSDRFFPGHVCFGAHRLLPKPSLYMTFVRSPVSRVISLYRYSRSTPHAYYHRQAREHDLEGFVFRSGLMELDNGQTRMIAGTDEDLFLNRRPIGGVDDALLSLAKRNLDKHFFFVGLRERFDESFLLWARKIGWETPSYISVNRSNHEGTEENLDPSLLSRIAETNRYDSALYEYCSRRFAEECARALPDRDLALSALKHRNARNLKIIRWPERWRNAVKRGKSN